MLQVASPILSKINHLCISPIALDTFEAHMVLVIGECVCSLSNMPIFLFALDYIIAECSTIIKFVSPRTPTNLLLRLK